jgi:hypothetical protein
VVRAKGEDEPDPSHPPAVPAVTDDPQPAPVTLPPPEQLGVARANTGPRPAEDDPRPAPLTLPAPEQLGVARTKTDHRPVVDWSDVQRRLDHLGALSLQQQKLLDGSYRVACVLPGHQGDHNYQVEAEGDNLAQAIGLTLDRAEKWVKSN